VIILVILHIYQHQNLFYASVLSQYVKNNLSLISPGVDYLISDGFT